MSREPAGRYVGLGGEPESMRLAGGTAALVGALVAQVPKDSVRLSSTVTGLELGARGVRLTYRDDAGSESSIRAEQVVAAMPPRLLQATVTFAPSLQPDTSALWRGTPTWMAGQAKFFALYESPFWLAAGLCGTAQGMVGPMLEMHDATTASGRAALFGFLGVSAVERRSSGERALTEACLTQFARIFGPEARAPVATVLKDWAADPLTSTGEGRSDAHCSRHIDHLVLAVHDLEAAADFYRRDSRSAPNLSSWAASRPRPRQSIQAQPR